MRRFGLFSLVFSLLVVSDPLLPSASLEAPLRAADPESPGKPQFINELRAGRVNEAAIYAHLLARAKEAEAGCRLDLIFSLRDDRDHFAAYLATLGPSAAEMRSRVSHINADECNPTDILDDMHYHAQGYNLDGIREELDKLKALAENFNRQARDARRAGAFGSINPERAESEAKLAQYGYDEGQKFHDRILAEVEKVRQIRAGATSKPVPAAEGRNEWGALLGRWSSRKHGGVIETTLTAGKVEGRIVSTNAMMTNRGYTPGMLVLRGWTPGKASLTWTVAARDGEYFTAAQRDRKPGETFGDPRWSRAGIIFIETKAPDRLQIPAALEERLSNYDPWVRVEAAPPR